METIFLNKEIQKLYTTGSNRKYRFQKNILTNFFEVVASLEASKNIYDLWNEPSLNFKKMNAYKNRYSLRINRKYCLEIQIEWKNEEETEGIIGIDTISTHYE